MRTALLALVCSLSLACNADILTPVQSSSGQPSLAARLGPSLAVAGNSGCFTVHGTISETGVAPSFAGTISGDLVGTSNTTLTDAVFTGAAGHVPGERTLTISGGTLSVAQPSTIATLYLSSGTLTGAGDISVTDLFTWTGGTLTGTRQFTFPWEVQVEYQGVICP